MTTRSPLAAIFGLLSLLVGLVGACEPQTAAEPGTLGDLEHLESPAGPWSGEPELAVAPDGGVYLTWLEARADSSRQLRFSVLDGDAWSEPRAVASGSDWFVSSADIPSILPLRGGRLVAHYLQRAGGEGASYAYGIRLVSSDDDGESWSRPTTPHRDSIAAEHGFASLFPAGDSAGIVWLDGRDLGRGDPPGATALRYSALAADGGLGPEAVLDSRVCDCCHTDVALTARGPVVAYRDRTPDEIRDIKLARRVDGRWLAGRPVHQDGWKIEACPVNGPSVAADGERVAVAWFTAARDTPRVLVAFSDDAGESFSDPVRVDGGSPAGRTGVVLVDDGGALVSWVERTDAGSAEVQARLVTSDGHLGNPVLIAHSAGKGTTGFPRMVRSGEQVVFAWTRSGSRPIVQTARLQLGGSR